MTRAEALQRAVQVVAEWRREAACQPAEHDRRHQVQMKLEAIVREVLGDN